MKLKKELKESRASLPNAPKSNGNLAKELSNLKVDIKKLEEKEAKVKQAEDIALKLVSKVERLNQVLKEVIEEKC